MLDWIWGGMLLLSCLWGLMEGRLGEVSAAALEDGFELHVDAFAEAADLILADPIHDVDEGMGWPVMKS